MDIGCNNLDIPYPAFYQHENIDMNNNIVGSYISKHLYLYLQITNVVILLKNINFELYIANVNLSLNKVCISILVSVCITDSKSEYNFRFFLYLLVIWQTTATRQPSRYIFRSMTNELNPPIYRFNLFIYNNEILLAG